MRLMNKRIVVIPFNVPWQWSTDYLNQTAYELAKMGNVAVCYLVAESWNLFAKNKGARPKFIYKHSNNLYIMNPYFLIPFRRFDIVEKINSYINIFLLRIITEYLSIVEKCEQKIFWIFDPNLIQMYNFFGRNYYLLYDCVDFFAIGSKDEVKKTNKNERELCTKANLVAANSKVLLNHVKKYRKDAVLVPQGFRIDGFKVVKKKYIDLKLKSPVIGFVGGINDRLDLSILYPLIKNNPKWNFVLWGPVQMRDKISDIYWDKLQRILKMPNVTYGTSSDKEEIPGLVTQFDICMIPYDISQDFNKYCYPMKLFEYFYLGKPVISTDIIELRRFPDLVPIKHTYIQWEKAIKDILSKKWPTENINKELQLSKENSWENKVSQIVDNIK